MGWQMEDDRFDAFGLELPFVRGNQRRANTTLRPDPVDFAGGYEESPATGFGEDLAWLETEDVTVDGDAWESRVATELETEKAGWLEMADPAAAFFEAPRRNEEAIESETIRLFLQGLTFQDAGVRTGPADTEWSYLGGPEAENADGELTDELFEGWNEGGELEYARQTPKADPFQSLSTPEDNAPDRFDDEASYDSRLREVARRLSAPEDAAQKELVRQLELPIAASDKRAIVERYDALRVMFGTMGPIVAKRMHERLTDKNDPLGDFMRLELADWHRAELIALAATRAKAGGSSPPPRPQPSGTVPPHQKPPPPRTITVPTPTGPQPPHGGTPQPTPQPRPPVVAPSGPSLPQPKNIIIRIDPTTPSWLANALSGVATMAGVGLSSLAAVVPAWVWEEAAQAAFWVFRLEGGTARALIGLAGERAAVQVAKWFLANKLGVDPGLIFNLNELLKRKNFPGLDLMGPRLLASVKTYGVDTSKTGKELTDYLISRYRNEANFLFNDFDDRGHADARYKKYQRKIAETIIQYKKVSDHPDPKDPLSVARAARFRPAWHKALGVDPSVDQIIRVIRDEAVMVVPDDHVQLVRWTKGRDYFIQYQMGQLPGFKSGLTDNEVAPLISDLVIRRFVSSGLKTSDYRMLADVARRLPNTNPLTRPKPGWLSTWGQPPPWTRAKAP